MILRTVTGLSAWHPILMKRELSGMILKIECRNRAGTEEKKEAASEENTKPHRVSEKWAIWGRTRKDAPDGLYL
jgi:hypothetical protein